MFDAFDRYMLALGILDGEPDTHKILGDLFEEQGDMGKAQWARSRKSGRKRRLEFTLGILPHGLAINLGCDFIEHLLLKVHNNRYTNPERLLTQFEIARLWVQGKVSEKELVFACRVLSNVIPDFVFGRREMEISNLHVPRRWHLEQCCRRLADALRQAKRLQGEAAEVHASKQMHFADQVCLETRRLAKEAREEAASELEAYNGWQYYRTTNSAARNDELSWQFHRTREALAESLESG